MSGGSYDYVYARFGDFAESLRRQKEDPRRAAFAKLVILVADAARDIEWVDSGDCSPGDEHASIDACFKFLEADPDTVIKARAFDTFKGVVSEWIK